MPTLLAGNGFQHFLASIIDDRDGLVGKALSNREELLQELIQAGNKPLNEDKYANISDAIVKAMKEKNITLEQIPYLSSDLSRATKEYRLNNRSISKGRNVAAVKFKNKDGIDDIFIRPSDGLHSEIEILTDGGFLERIGGQGNFHNIDELYTELQPCNIQPSFCIKQLAIGNKNIPSGLSNANITYSFNYSDYPNALSGDKLRQLENKVKYAAFREDPDLGKVYWKGRRK